MSKPQPRFHFNRRRATQRAVGLALIACGALLLADIWHQWCIRQEVVPLQNLVAQVEGGVQHGVSASAWQESRIKGSNGWREVAFLWDAGAKLRELERKRDFWAMEESREGRLWLQLKQLQNYSMGEWIQPTPEDADRTFVPRQVPTADELRSLLDATESMPDACRKAEACDVVSPVQLAGTSTEDWSQSLLVFDSGTIRTAMIGRVKALVELGETSKAESELLTYAQFWSKYNLPLNWSDGRSTAVGGASGCLQLASELCREGKVSDRTIREILSLSFDGDRLFAEAMAGEVVWACLLLRRGEYSLRKPGWFEWLSARQSTPPGWGVYESPFLRFGQRAEYCHEVRALLMHDLQFLHLVRNPKPWDQVEPVDISCEWCWGYFVQALPEESMGFRQVNMAWLELKLHSLQRKSGPLHNQRAAVERLLGEQPYAGYRWKGTTLVIFPVPIMEFAPGYTESGENAQRVLEIRLDPTD